MLDSKTDSFMRERLMCVRKCTSKIVKANKAKRISLQMQKVWVWIKNLPSKNLEKCYANATPTGLLVPFPARKIVEKLAIK